MGTEQLDKDIRQLQARVGRIRERAAGPETSTDMTQEALAELSSALEELRVRSEDLNRQNEKLRVAHGERENERRKYLDLFHSAPAGYVVTDVEGKVSEVNKAAQRLFGASESTILRKPLAFRFVASDLVRLMPMLTPGSPSPSTAELHLRRRGQPPFPVNVVRTAILDDEGSVVGYRWSFHDLTSSRQMNERLRQSEGLLRSLVDGAQDFAIFRLDPAGLVASWNRGAERIFGYQAREVIGRSFETFRAPDDGFLSESQLLVLADRYGRSEVEGWRLHKNGTRIWTNSVITPLRDAGGRPTGFVHVMRDVSDRRRTEEALAERSRLLALQAQVGASLTEGKDLDALLRRSAAAILVNLGTVLVRIWTHDEKDGMLHLRAQAGHPPPEEKRLRAIALSSALEAARAARRRRPRVTGMPFRDAKASFLKWAGRHAVSCYSAHPLLLDDHLVGLLELFLRKAPDETMRLSLESVSRSLALGIERLHAQEQVAHALQQLELTMETMPEAVFTLDGEGRLVQWNRKLETVTGLSRRRLEGRSIADLVPSAEVALVRKMVAEAVSTGDAEWEGHLVRGDGALAPISWVLASRRDPHGKAVGLTGSGRDITERREAEMRLAQLSRRLLHLREEEQRRIARELHDSTAQNLSVLCMNVTTLSRSRGMLDEASRRTLEETAELANRCLAEIRTISYLLHPPLLDEVGLPAALRWYLKGFSKRSGLRVRALIPADLGRMGEGLELTLFRIVQESLMNVHRHARAREVRVALRRRQASVFLEVADDGRGMEGARRGTRAGTRAPRRSKPERAKAASGAAAETGGMGLIGIRERVRERHGQVDIASGAKGTTVRVELPFEKRSAS